ncbi:DUF5985 family protein [uncultured Massilia sp.]|uniref:DUF5985 family protein n=1 Tax=uncultured Massilia sp. TaxID=169973 RepID=UPI002600E7AA|nr:DUF5985 family protein [uncultured Massilia sp.]
MAAMIYALCALTSLACTWLLLGSYRRTRHRLLFWSGASFAALTVNNVFLVLDKVVFPDVYLMPVRQGTALLSVLLLLYGLIYEKE